MTTTRIKQKLSKVFQNQLPEFIRSDYTTFVAFLRAYYEYLEQDQYAQELIQNQRSYNDIDTTINSFIERFLQLYGEKIPRTLTSDQRFTVKQLKSLYNNKGNESSYELFFKLLFNKKSDVIYPSRQVLKVSDGRWVRNSSIFLRTLVGDPADIENQIVTLITPTSKIQLQILKKREVVELINNIPQTSPDTFEFFIDDTKNFNIQPGDVIEYGAEFGNIPIVGNPYRGVVESVPIAVEIVDSGANFKPGNIFSVTSGNGIGALLKVIKTTPTGGLRVVQLFGFGLNYSVDFYAYLSAESLIAVTGTDAISTPNSVLVTDRMLGLVDFGTINITDYAPTAFEASYVGTVLGSFSSDTGAITGTPVDGSVIVRVGGKAKYPGYYETNNGFISDEIYLQDNAYYQPFSYLVRVEERLSDYKKALLELLHPAGTRLFADYTLENQIEIITELTDTFKLLDLLKDDMITVTDSITVVLNPP